MISQAFQSAMPTWGFIDKGFKATPYLGTKHLRVSIVLGNVLELTPSTVFQGPFTPLISSLYTIPMSEIKGQQSFKVVG